MYLIDGYNLLYATEFETREQLLSALNTFFVYCKKSAKIIFDGYSEEDLNTEFVQVEFAGDADERIAEIIKTCDNPSYYVLVSSDKELRYLARQKKIKTIKVEEYNFEVPTAPQVDEDDRSDFHITDSEVVAQLKEYNNFKS
ncbi:NYN domain-containing protein [Candidatus Kuenenbacteria bacterium]|nr:NYN domain-containing protein [Candidatus Kuenenbacteria bacterium]